MELAFNVTEIIRSRIKVKESVCSSTFISVTFPAQIPCRFQLPHICDNTTKNASRDVPLY